MKGRSWEIYGGKESEVVAKGPVLKYRERVRVHEILPTDLLISRELFEKVTAALEAVKISSEEYSAYWLTADSALAAIKESEKA